MASQRKHHAKHHSHRGNDKRKIFYQPLLIKGNVDAEGSIQASSLYLKGIKAKSAKHSSIFADKRGYLHYTNKCGHDALIKVESTNPLVGWWQQTLRGSFVNTMALWHIYEAEDCTGLRAHLYAGSLGNVDGSLRFREWTPEDFANARYNFSPGLPNGLPGTNDVHLIQTGPDQYVVNYVDPTTSDYLTSVQNHTILRPSKSDLDVLWVLSLDSPVYHQILRLVRLDGPPEIIPYAKLTHWDFSNPVEMFKQMTNSILYNGNIRSSDSPGWNNLLNRRHQLLTTGVKYKSTVRDVWRTRPVKASSPESIGYSFPASTTIFTNRFNGRAWGAHIKITGFTSTRGYDMLNSSNSATGYWKASFYENDLARDDSNGDYFNIDLDTSKLPPYDAKIDGVAEVSISFPAVVPNSSYYDLIGALADFTRYAGTATHQQIVIYVKRTQKENHTTLSFYDSFDQLRRGIEKGTAYATTLRSRGSFHQGGTIYNNAVNTVRVGAVPSNLPYPLTVAKLDYLIDIQNYLDPEHVYNSFWAVTGPVLPTRPLTGRLVELSNGYYRNNGSEFIFDVAPYGSAGPDKTFNWQVSGDDPTHLFFGLINPIYTGGVKVGYVFTRSSKPPDALYGYSLYPEFTRSDLPEGIGNWLPWLASIFGKLRSLGATKIIYDNRNQVGGSLTYPFALASFFGGDRPGITHRYALADNGNTALISDKYIAEDATSKELLEYITRYETINTNLVAEKFPDAIFRGSDKKVVILTNTNAIGAGDMIPHLFTDPNVSDSHQIGEGVVVNIVGEVDGRVLGSSSAPLALYNNIASIINGKTGPLHHFHEQGGLIYRAGSNPYSFANTSSHITPTHPMSNSVKDTTLVDLGYVQPYPNYGFVLPQKGQPLPDDKASWRDLWLEAALYLALSAKITNTRIKVTSKVKIIPRQITYHAPIAKGVLKPHEVEI